MSLLIEKTTPIIAQGVTGYEALFSLKKSLAYGMNIVGYIDPKPFRDGLLGIPRFSSVEEAQNGTPVFSSIIFSPPERAKEAILEAIACAIPQIFCFTEKIPIHDMLQIKQRLRFSSSLLIGPSSSGIITPEVCFAGFLHPGAYQRGSLGILSRSASLGYKVACALSREQMGISTHLSIGSDRLLGMGFFDALRLFDEDPCTKAVLLLGEKGDEVEKELADLFETPSKQRTKKPLGLYIAGERTRHFHLGRDRPIVETFAQKSPFVAEELADLVPLATTILENAL